MTVQLSIWRILSLLPLTAVSMGFAASLALVVLHYLGISYQNVRSGIGPVEQWFFGGLSMALFGAFVTIPLAFFTQPVLIAVEQSRNLLNLRNHMIANAVLGPVLALVFFPWSKSAPNYLLWLSQDGRAATSASVGLFSAVACGLVWYLVLVDRPSA